MANKMIIRPHEGFQKCFVKTNVDVAFGGGSLGSGKSFGEVLSVAEESLDPNWRGLFLRNNLDDLKAGGGLIDTFREVYGNYVQIRTADMPRVLFPTGSYVDITHAADQSVEALLRRFKGRQYDTIVFDELTGFSWDAFKTILSRNRGKSKYTGKCRASTNPERESWIRKFIDWYIDEEGFIIPERDGVVRYFYMMGSDVDDVVWGNSKEEVYRMCKVNIDKKLDKVYGYMKGRDKWPSMIKSFTFYLGRMSENTEMLDNNEGYLGSIAMSGGAEAAKLLEGNWNVSSKEEKNTLITLKDAEAVFTNDPQVNNDRWVTCDLADFGTDNFVALAWDGFHIIGILILTKSTPKENAEKLRAFARQYDVADSHIIYDAVRGRYINDYIPNAIPFESSRSTMGVYGLQYMRLKDECYGKLVYLIQNGYISCDESVAKSIYTHQNLKERITFETEFIEEARVVRFVEVQNGKLRLMTKKEMNRELGRGRSMDVLDPCAMRMLPVLKYVNGEELIASAQSIRKKEDESGEYVDIYDETNFY